jgi:acetyl-CoA carboxylase / biotin carboxylase 1
LPIVNSVICSAKGANRDSSEAVKESFRKGQVSVAGIPAINSFDVEIAYKDA